MRLLIRPVLCATTEEAEIRLRIPNRQAADRDSRDAWRGKADQAARRGAQDSGLVQVVPEPTAVVADLSHLSSGRHVVRSLIWEVRPMPANNVVARYRRGLGRIARGAPQRPLVLGNRSVD